MPPGIGHSPSQLTLTAPSKRGPRASLFVLLTQVDKHISLFNIHYSFGGRCNAFCNAPIYNRKEPGADDQSAPGSFRKEKRGKKMKVFEVGCGSGFTLVSMYIITENF